MSSCFWLENWTVQKGFGSIPGTACFDVFFAFWRDLFATALRLVVYLDKCKDFESKLPNDTSSNLNA